VQIFALQISRGMWEYKIIWELLNLKNKNFKENLYKHCFIRIIMGIVLVKIKIMPTSPDVNLEEIKTKAKLILEKNKGKQINFAEEPIAFGLKAVIAGFSLDEEFPLDPIEEKFQKIKNVNSVQVVDMRRAFG